MLSKKEEQLNAILNCLEKKDLSIAKTKLNHLLIAYPNDHILENIYGFILAEENNYADAIFRFRKSIKINTNFSDGYYNLASLLSKVDLNDEAIENFKKAINLKSNYFEAHYGLANLYSKISNFLEAEKNYKICLNIRPDSLEVLNNLGINLRKEKKFSEAIEIFNKLLNLDQQYVLAYNNLGMIYYETGNLEKALHYLSEAIKIKLDYFEAYENLGLVYFSVQKYSQAIFFYKKAIELNANFYSAYTNLGNVYKELGDYDNAVLFHKKTIEIRKDFYEGYINLAKTYIKSKKKYIEAISVLKEVISLKKDYAEAYSALGVCYMEIGEAITGANCFEKSLEIDSNLIDSYAGYIFNSLYIKNFSQKKYFQLTSNFFKLMSKEFNYISKATKFHHKNEKLRIGFVSADFRNHPVGYFLEGILKFLKNDNEIEIFAYSNYSFEDDLTARIKPLFFEWTPIYSIDDLNVINKIRDHKIDILVDLSGHTYLNRLSVFLEKPAPIQVSWAGYLASTGLDKIDYILTDPHVVLKEYHHQFKEKSYQMPNVWCHFSKPEINLIINEKTPAQKNNYITFGSFNNLAKINLEVISLWSKILNSVPNSKIFLKTKSFNDIHVKDNFIQKFSENNIDSSRIILEGFENRKILLEKYNLIDIALDPFPYTGGTTSFEASWMCVPILTLAGYSFLSKCGESININLGMKDWIARDEEEYLNKAIKFSSNLEELNIVKKKLNDQKKLSKIFDSETFASDLSNAFKEMSKNL